MGRKGKKSKKQLKNKNTGNKESKGSRKRKNRESLRKIAAQNFGKFVEQLDNLGLRIKEVKGDGNCLFRSVSDQIEGNENNHYFYRQSAIEYMVENQDHFKFFIEDDKTFESYIADMSKDGTWGGNLELYAMSMKFSVNFYIYIYNHPMYIVKNFAVPFRNVHLTYHDGEHYNSVRLKSDLEEDIPVLIPLEMINCVEQTTNVQALDDANHEEEDEEDDEEEEKPSKKVEQSIHHNGEENNTNSNEINFHGTIIKDSKEKLKSDKFKKCILTREGIIMDEIKDMAKCHCSTTNKKYKNCCISEDVKGDFDKQANIFYCDVTVFKSRCHYEVNDKNKEAANTNAEVNQVTKQMEKIFI